jgi:hypothetical protein
MSPANTGSPSKGAANRGESTEQEDCESPRAKKQKTIPGPYEELEVFITNTGKNQQQKGWNQIEKQC